MDLLVIPLCSHGTEVYHEVRIMSNSQKWLLSGKGLTKPRDSISQCLDGTLDALGLAASVVVKANDMLLNNQ